MTVETIIILSMVQGITEFLPISSSAHLIIIPEIFGSISSKRSFDVSLHFGSLLAVLFYLKKDISRIAHDTIFIKKNNQEFITVKNLIISTITIVLIGILIHFNSFNIIRMLEIQVWSHVGFVI